MLQLLFQPLFDALAIPSTAILIVVLAYIVNKSVGAVTAILALSIIIYGEVIFPYWCVLLAYILAFI